MICGGLIQVKTGSPGARIIKDMKKFGVSVVALLQTMALAAIFVFASADAHAHTPGNSGDNAAHGPVFDKSPHELDCTSFIGGGHMLHCHLTSTGAEATGPVPPLDDDQPALVTCSVNLPAHNTDRVLTLAAIPVSIAGPPRFILFGNFRS